MEKSEINQPDTDQPVTEQSDNNFTVTVLTKDALSILLPEVDFDTIEEYYAYGGLDEQGSMKAYVVFVSSMIRPGELLLTHLQMDPEWFMEGRMADFLKVCLGALEGEGYRGIYYKNSDENEGMWDKYDGLTEVGFQTVFFSGHYLNYRLFDIGKTSFGQNEVPAIKKDKRVLYLSDINGIEEKRIFEKLRRNEAFSAMPIYNDHFSVLCILDPEDCGMLGISVNGEEELTVTGIVLEARTQETKEQIFKKLIAGLVYKALFFLPATAVVRFRFEDERLNEILEELFGDKGTDIFFQELYYRIPG